MPLELLFESSAMQLNFTVDPALAPRVLVGVQTSAISDSHRRQKALPAKRSASWVSVELTRRTSLSRPRTLPTVRLTETAQNQEFHFLNHSWICVGTVRSSILPHVVSGSRRAFTATALNP